MNSKEAKFFEELQKEGDRCAKAGAILYDAARGAMPAAEGYETIRQLRRGGRAALPGLHEKMQRAFGGETVIEDARVLVRKLDRLLNDMKDMAQLLSIYGTELPARLQESIELVRFSVLELSRMFGYMEHFQEEYMKAAARSQRILNYEERGDRAFRTGMAELFEASPDPLYVIRWKDLYERAENILDSAAGSAEFFQKVTQRYLKM